MSLVILPKRFSQKILKIFSAIVIFFISLAIFFGADIFFKIKNIEVLNNQNKTILGTGDFKGKNILLISEAKIIYVLKRKNPFIKDAKVVKKYPNSLTILLDLYDPKALLKADEGYLTLSSDGRIILKSKDLSLLPVINYYQRINYYSYDPGEIIDHRPILLSIYFINRLSELNIVSESLDIKGDNMIVFNLSDDRSIIISAEKEKQGQAYLLMKIIKQFKVEGKNFKSLDLRFDKPIIRF